MTTRKKKAAPKKAESKKAPAPQAPAGGPARQERAADPKADRFERILGLFNDSGLAELEYEDKELAIKVARHPTARGPAAPAAPAPPAAAAPVSTSPPSSSGGDGESRGQVVSSPFVGTFYRSPSPEAPPFTEVGHRVGKGQTLCIIEAMKLMNEIPSEYDGVVTKVLVSDGDVVQYGDALFEIGPG